MDALLLVDVLKDFEHEDGDRLLASFRARHASLVELLASARERGAAVVYANDAPGGFDATAVVQGAVAGKGGALVADVVPAPSEPVVLKDRYSAFHGTRLASELAELDVTKLTIAGTATEMCVFLSAVDAVRLDLDVTVAAGACATIDEEHEALALDYLERVLGVAVPGRR